MAEPTAPGLAEGASDFLRAAGWGDARVEPLAGDASSRRYLRLYRQGTSAVLMLDAPHAPEAFVRIAGYLADQGLSPPSVLATDMAKGLVLLEDLGDALVSRLARPARAYLAAGDVLAALHRAPLPSDISAWAGSVPGDQAALAAEEYAGRPEAAGELADAVSEACARLAGPASVLMLRDVHADNLVWLPDRRGAARVGLLDFQDAMAGPAGYDLVSLLRDARRDVDPALSARVRRRYLATTGQTADGFAAAEAAIGAARQLRILGVFARLARQGKRGYLIHMARVWRYLRADVSHPDLARLGRIVERHLPAPDALRPELRP
ncbi:MAG: aminoglycoside phosphotransferase family protein [Alkalilacustris sp.]